LDTNNAHLRERFQQGFLDRSMYLRKMSEKLSAGLLPFSTDDNVINVLRRAYGKRRSSRRSH